MNNHLSEIYLRRSSKVIIEEGVEDENSVAYATSVMANMNAIGFTLSKSAYEKLCSCSSEQIVKFNEETMPILKDMIGDNRKYRSFYPNFPQDAMERGEALQYFDQIIHYAGTYLQLNPEEPFLPEGQRKERLPLVENHDLKMIDEGSQKDFRTSMKNLMGSAISLPEHEKENLKTFFRYENMSASLKCMPNAIPNKENLASIAKILHENKIINNSDKYFRPYFKTATDVLRFATALSDGDVSLATNTKFRNFSRSERRLILDLVEHCGSKENIEQDMKKYSERWKRLAEKTHPGEFIKQYPVVNSTIHKLREYKKAKNKIITDEGHIQEMFNRKDDFVIELLKKNPGNFAAKLNKCLNIFEEEKVLNAFESVAEKISVPVLIRVQNYFKYNRNDQLFRAFTPKGQPCFCLPNQQDNLPQNAIDRIDSICQNALEAKFSQKSPLGKVYIDESIKNFATPLKIRDENKGTKFMTEGTVIPGDKNSNFIRPYIWWTNNKDSTVDIDMSATCFDDKFDVVGVASYYSSMPGITKSGDIVDGGNVDGPGVAEFLDINKKELSKSGVKYIVINSGIFNGVDNYAHLTHSSFGFMERNHQLTGDEFEPSTVKNNIEMNNKATNICPVIYDVEKEQFIWVGRMLTQERTGVNIDNTLGGISAELYRSTQLHVPQLYDLLSTHAKVRGEIVDSPDKADIVYAAERGDLPDTIKVITPYDSELIMSDYMNSEKDDEEFDREMETEVQKAIDEYGEKAEEAGKIEMTEEDQKKQNLMKNFSSRRFDEER